MSRIARARDALKLQQTADSEKIIDFKHSKRGTVNEG